MSDYRKVIGDAVKYYLSHGYESPEKIALWSDKILAAITTNARDKAKPTKLANETLKKSISKMTSAAIRRNHKGIPTFTINNIRPDMREALNRRILASADLIKLNREASIDATMRRFAGWATSQPAGGAGDEKIREVSSYLTKPLRESSFQERRVLIDQSSKLIANINETIAESHGAIAMIWHSQWKRAGYDYREDHKERDGKIWLINDSWAVNKGLVKKDSALYYDNITHVAQEPYCSCTAEYLYSLNDIPENMLTRDGLKMIKVGNAAD